MFDFYGSVFFVLAALVCGYAIVDYIFLRPGVFQLFLLCCCLSGFLKLVHRGSLVDGNEDNKHAPSMSAKKISK
jgi:hypothetical protein